MLSRLSRQIPVISAALIAALCLLPTTFASAKGPSLDLLNATPVGSWQIREETNTTARGKQTVSVVKTSMLGEEVRDGERHLWMEVSVDEFKVRKSKKGDKRKKTGQQMVMKILIPASVFTADPANAIANMRSVGKEMIFQSGNSDPMIMRDLGAATSGLLQSMGAQINFDFTEEGNEEISVPAGTFVTTVMTGTGSTTVNAVFKQINVSSTTRGWYSQKMPFGIVKASGETTTNGKTTTQSSQVIEYGMAGATSLITKTPQEMPQIPNLKGLLGGGSN